MPGGGIDGPMSGGFTDLFAVVACGAVVTGAEAVTIPLLRRAAIIDVPGHRSSHAIPTPRGGGIPIVAGLLVAAVMIGGAKAIGFAFAVAAFGGRIFLHEKVTPQRWFGVLVICVGLLLVFFSKG